MNEVFWSNRYGDLGSIADLTRSRCHLCHERVDLALYGRTGQFGPETVTVDHLDPQVFGGGDERENLRIAHGTCNSLRGIDDPEVVRGGLAKTSSEPMSAGTFNLLSVGGSIAVGAVAGHVWASTTPQGQREFNWRAALACGLLTFAATRAFY